jgi:hypothetical protein
LIKRQLLICPDGLNILEMRRNLLSRIRLALHIEVPATILMAKVKFFLMPERRETGCPGPTSLMGESTTAHVNSNFHFHLPSLHLISYYSMEKEIMQLLFLKKVLIVLVRSSVMETIIILIAFRGCDDQIDRSCNDNKDN